MPVNNAPYPSFVKIYYHSAFAPHVMTIPAHNFANGFDITAPGLFTTWAAGTIAGDVMVEDMIGLIAALYDTDNVFDRYEIWTKSTPTAIPRLNFAKVHSVAGSGAFTGWKEAVQRTYFLRATDNSAFKLILLDAPTDNQFGKYYSLTTAENLVIAELTSASFAWQSRKGFQPAFFKALTITLNERLRREYHLR